MTVKVEKYHVLVATGDKPLIKKDIRDGSLAFFEELKQAEACRKANPPSKVVQVHYVNHSDYLALEENRDMAIEELEGAANFLRGIMLDPALPSHIKDAMTFKLFNMDAVLDHANFESLDE
ncbi:hypothetical protein MM188_003203 [Vibrio cholerae]|nr:hypothetical protein [Vibrio cholerae]